MLIPTGKAPAGLALFALAALVLLFSPEARGHEGDAPAHQSLKRFTERDPDNRCALSRVEAIGDRRSRLDPEAAERLLDSDPESGVLLGSGAPRGFEVAFTGAPHWLNQIEVIASPGELTIEIRDLDEQWRPFGQGRIEGPLPGMLHLDGPDTKARGLRVMLAGQMEDAPPAEVFEIGAFFEQTDPDGGALADAAGNNFHYDWCNDYPGSNDDLSKCDDDAEGLWNELPSDWDLFGGHGNAGALEIHVKRNDIGDGENSNHIDGADLAYYAGHGDESDFDSYFGEDLTSTAWCTTNDDDDGLPSDARFAWGDGDMEWIALGACWILKSSSRDEWAVAFEGAHLICGAATTIPDADYGTEFAQGLVDNGAFDSAKTVKTAWFDAMDKRAGPADKAVVIGENSTMGGDYIWGEGTVHSDPTVDDFYSAWTYTLPSQARQEGAGETDALFASATPMASPSGELIVFPARTERGFTVTIDQGQLQRAEPTQMRAYDVVPVVVDSGDVRQVANRLCALKDVLCGGDIGPGDPGDVNLIDGAHELRVCLPTGAAHYEDTDRWLVNRTSPPELLEGDEAIQRANQILASLDRLPADAVVSDVDYLWQQGRTKGPQGGMDPDSSFAIGTRVVYRRQLGQNPPYPVVGPGGAISVGLGANGVLLRLFEGGWRPLTPGPLIPILSIQDAVEALTTFGWDAAVEELRTQVDEIQVVAWDLGYYEPPCDEAVPRILPVYILHCMAGDEEDPLAPLDVYVWADGTQPRPRIVTPPDGTEVPVGSQVCFTAQVVDGVAPYTLRWTDDRGRDLGQGASICTHFDAPPPGDGSEDWIRTVELTVRDARGREGTAFVTLVLTEPADVTDPAAAGPLWLGPSAPNPFVGSTALSFRIPSGGGDAAASLRIFDVGGREVRSIVDAALRPGSYRVTWDGRDGAGRRVPAGVYFAKLRHGAESLESRMLLVP